MQMYTMQQWYRCNPHPHALPCALAHVTCPCVHVICLCAADICHLHSSTCQQSSVEPLSSPEQSNEKNLRTQNDNNPAAAPPRAAPPARRRWRALCLALEGGRGAKQAKRRRRRRKGREAGEGPASAPQSYGRNLVNLDPLRRQGPRGQPSSISPPRPRGPRRCV